MEVGEAVSVTFGMDQKEDKEWVSFQLVYEVKDPKSGRTIYAPIGGEKYEGDSPDGPIDGELEGSGVCGMRGVTPGKCNVEFPDFYQRMKDWARERVNADRSGE